MRKKKASIIAATQDQDPEQIIEDLFFRRIEVQSRIIKKMLSEIDPSAKPEEEQVPEKKKKMNFPFIVINQSKNKYDEKITFTFCQSAVTDTC